MANPHLAHAANVPGDFYVDTTCIDCPICRQIAPATFGDAPEQAVVVRQPASDEERTKALMALVSCPAGSVGNRAHVNTQLAVEALPDPIAEAVYWCGFASRDSYGAQSYFISRADGNVLIDSPRFAGSLVNKLEKLGGIRYMILTHQDDVADHERFRRHFGCQRVIHAADTGGSLKDAEQPLKGDGPWQLTPDLKLIATPGHTRGHIVILYRDTFLFTGDHLFWRKEVGGLDTSRLYNQYSWEAQIGSVEKLLDEPFTWVLPGHGYRFQADRETMREELVKAMARMRD
ncbi:MAG: MBL fold metallo-hydrolase [Elusimicrobia bacterium]|nr:MBL fold metallo-hydrolase [Elusimicrobiota bacterium]